MSFRLPCPACGAPVPLDDGAACAGCRTELRRDGGVIVLDDVAGEGAYPPGLYPLDERVEERHWWHASRNAVIERALAPWRRRRGLATLVEVGCGTGFVLRHLERMGFAVAGIDMQIDGLRIAAARTEAPLVRTGAGRIPFVDPVDVVALCDVLEHAEEEPLLASCRDALRPGGVLLVTVPARPSLWSLEDVLVGHRRYRTARWPGRRGPLRRARSAGSGSPFGRRCCCSSRSFSWRPRSRHGR